jgi:phosphoglycolate phosphatase-like HAD superfamily hydrolase
VVLVLALLDLDGTLVDRDAGFRAWGGVRGREGPRSCRGAWLMAWDRAAQERGRFFAGVVDRFGFADDPDGLWRDYRARMPELTPAFPGVADVLDRRRLVPVEAIGEFVDRLRHAPRQAERTRTGIPVRVVTQ